MGALASQAAVQFIKHWNRYKNMNISIGLLQQTITWYKIRHAGGQAHYYSPTGTLKQRDLNQSSLTCLCPSGGIIMSLPYSMADFVPCDRLLQKAYYKIKRKAIHQSRTRKPLKKTSRWKKAGNV